MALPFATAFLTLSFLCGVCLCLFGIDTYRRWEEPGANAFAVFLLFIGTGATLGAGVEIVGIQADSSLAAMSLIDVLALVFSLVPWILFGLQYTGRYTDPDWRSVGLLSFPIVGLIVTVALVRLVGTTLGPMSGAVGRILSPVGTIVATVVVIYVLGLMTVGGYLVVRTAYRYGHFSVTHGLAVALMPIILFIPINLHSRFGSSTVVAGIYASGFLIFTLIAGLTLYRFDIFQSAPAVGEIGERAIVRETDELMFVVDDEGRVIRLNRTVTDRLDITKTDALGNQLVDVLGTTVRELEEMETIELMTDEGRRQFDPVISELTDQHGQHIGYTLALHDVTELELREQRLEVLNRVLRHNLRNQVEVIKSNAEYLAMQTEDEHADTIIDSADRLTELGRSARSIDKIVSRPSKTATVDLQAAIMEHTDRVDTGNPVSMSLSLTEGTVETDRQALEAAIESAIDGAFSRATDSVELTLESITEGYCLRIEDNGPGIPDDELASVAAGTETALQHATGLGLWQLKWAVTKLNGDLSIENRADGTEITIKIPDQDR